MGKHSRRKYQLWLRDPRCYWCGKVTVILDLAKIKKPPLNLATLDHLRSRLSNERGSDYRVSTVLACLECNQNRAKVEEKQTLSIGQIRQRAGRWPSWMRELEQALKIE